MSVREYLNEDTGVTYYDARVHMRSSQFPEIRIQKFRRCSTKEKAEKAEKELIREASIELRNEELRGTLWGVVLHKWEAQARSLGRNPTTLKPMNENSLIKVMSLLNHWTSDWNTRPSRELSIKDGKDLLLATTSEDLKPSTIRKLKTYVNLVFRFGVLEGLIEGVKNSPVYGVPFDLTDGDSLPEILTMNQTSMLLAWAKHYKTPWYPIWATALMTGMRSSELYALRKENVVMDEGIIRVTESWDWVNNCAKSTKAGYWRTAPINSQLREILVICMAQNSDSPYVFPRLEEWTDGRQAIVLRDFCKLIGIPSIRFHTLRACFATHLLSLGIEPATIMAIGGWSNFKTFKIYVRLAGVTERHKTEGLGERLISNKVSFTECVEKIDQMVEIPRTA